MTLADVYLLEWPPAISPPTDMTYQHVLAELAMPALIDAAQTCRTIERPYIAP